ncbi:MAG: glycoside hydrolase family 15 protein [Cyanobacteria bacterium P01_G01_bin.39]
MISSSNGNSSMLLQDNYSSEDIQNIFNFLQEKGTFNFPALPNGLFSAAILKDETAYTGYAHVWIRDNIYVAYTHYICGSPEIAVTNVCAIASYFKKYQHRFENIIQGKANPENVMERPHVRFVGATMQESAQKWQHGQNDALGYFLWLYCKLVIDGLITPELEDWKLLGLFPSYFSAIRYWSDEDSGHWEEQRKIEASSIGIVVAGLKTLQQLLVRNSYQTDSKVRNELLNTELIDKLIVLGNSALAKILPAECIQSPPQGRRYDAALIFLVYPLQIVEQDMAKQIIQDVINNLQGDYGIRRYLGDSFWCRDYRDLPVEIRTTVSSDREQWLANRGKPLIEGEEAQWCIFDPIMSIFFGQQYQLTKEQKYLNQQIKYLNRSLSQLTDEEDQNPSFRCPELYYLQDGSYISNDSTPLLWTQANLRIAFKVMQQSLSLNK